MYSLSPRTFEHVTLSLLIVYFLRSPSRVLPYGTLSVDCLFLRSPSRVLYRTELIPRAPNLRISIGMPNFEMRISIQSTIVPVRKSLVQWLQISIQSTIVPVRKSLVQWLTESRFGISKFGIPIVTVLTLKINNQHTHVGHV